MSITGNLRTLELAELLQWLAQGQKSGALVVENGHVEKRIYFRSGKIVCSESNNPEEHLGGYLIRQGLIDEATLSRAVKLQESTQILLGKVLVTLGSISEEELHRILQLKTEESIYELFTWEEGEFHFVPDDLPEQPMVPLKLEVTNVVLEGMKRLDEARRDAQESTQDLAAQYASEIEEAVEGDLYQPRELDSAEVTAEESSSEYDISAFNETETLGSGEELLISEEPSSTEVRGYYHSGRSKFTDNTTMLALIAAVATLVLGASAYFFVRPEPAAGTAERATLERSPAFADAASGLRADEFSQSELSDPEQAYMEPEPVVQDSEPPTETVAQSDQSNPDAEIRAQYEAEVAALKQQLQKARQVAEGRKVAMQMLQASEETSEPNLAKLSPMEMLDTDNELPAPSGLAADLEDAAGGDEPPTLAGTIPAREVDAAPGSDLAEELVQVPPEIQTASDAREAARSPASQPTAQAAAVTPPVLISKPKPRYPPAALRLGRQAEVTVRLLIDEVGEVQEAERVGPLAGMGFDQAALAAARRTSWQPATREGVPVPMWAELRIAFRP